jgi:hypothetical protein
MILHWFLLACVPILSNREKSIFGGQWNHYPIFIIQFIYTTESICKTIAYGLIMPPKSPNYNSTTSSSLSALYPSLFKLPPFSLLSSFHKKQPPKTTLNDTIDPALSKSSTFVERDDFVRNHRAYLNSFGNVLDAISVISYWADFALMLVGYPYLSLFKSLGAMRPIRLLSILPGTAVILKSLETSWDILLAVSLLILFFLLLFALLGLISFQGIFSRRCYFTDSSNECKCAAFNMYFT